MAKVGNEVKLILSLAAEHTATKLIEVDSNSYKASTDYKIGFRRGLEQYQTALNNIVLECEGK